MSELLKSGKIGLCDKSTEETTKSWEALGFLEGLEGSEKIKIALLFEKTANILLNSNNYHKSIDVVIFPIIRRAATAINRLVNNKERAEGMFQLITAELILKRANEIYFKSFNFYEELFSSTLSDIEAECVLWVSEMIAHEYIQSFVKKDIINLGDNKFDIITRET